MTKLPENFELDRYGLHVRLVREEDAEFIVKLRTDPKLSRFLNKTDNNVCKQIEWIREYKKREEDGTDYYFMFSRNGEKLGVARIYNILATEFTSGSLLTSPNAVGIGVICDIVSHEIAYDIYPNSINYFDIRKGNKNVIRYAQSYHPVLYKEDAENLYFYNNKQNFEKHKQLYLRMAKL